MFRAFSSVTVSLRVSPLFGLIGRDYQTVTQPIFEKHGIRNIHMQRLSVFYTFNNSLIQVFCRKKQKTRWFVIKNNNMSEIPAQNTLLINFTPIKLNTREEP